MKRETIGIIGTGVMGGIIARGAEKSGYKVVIFDPDPPKTGSLASSNISVAGTSRECCQRSALCILAVKPNLIAAVSREIAEEVIDRTILSIAAGVHSLTIGELLGHSTAIIRIMPNTPAQIGEGISALCRNQHVSDDVMAHAMAIFSHLGRTLEVPESLMDAVTGLSGSGPAYAYTFIQALTDGGVKMGIPRDKALLLSAQTLLGAAKMVLETGDNPITLRGNVTTPGGTTIEAVHVLEKAGFSGIVMDAVEAATIRSRELGAKK